MNTYVVKVLREPGVDPLTGQFTPQCEELLTIGAESQDAAYRQSFRRSTLKFSGQVRKIFIDGVEYVNPRF